MKLVPLASGFTVRPDKVMDELEMSVEAEGFVPGTPEFEVALRAQKVEKCKEVKGYLTCSQCPAVLDCSLRLAYMKDGIK